MPCSAQDYGIAAESLLGILGSYFFYAACLGRAAESKDEHMLLLEFFAAKRYSGADRIYVAPHIPHKLLNNALESYGLNEDPASIRVLIDDTLFGSG